ncbi:hypothetical protein CAPTEDRAFT_183158 [Capitella teleta]|uniref:CXXC motif containing zinc binding protein n=1 Tax=Capitella teleta TaxID=283909 RepID=R7TZU3_CAPTE|nr:hypothetical protein CAPTEDRAFT_183158 [Capitella teleta]|eukprot:ELT99147.1 hypothetical protein CAPTEDRAFT_183158 [Capitella teleta]
MVKIGLQLKAQLEKITNLRPEGDDFRWYMKLKCVNCGEETPDFVYLTLEENQPLKGGRGHASLVLKCKGCMRENSIDIIQDSIGKYTMDDCPKFKTIVAFDCRGVEPIAFDPRVSWSAEGEETRSPFAVDLSQGDWADFDEKNSESVGIYELENQFVSLKH